MSLNPMVHHSNYCQGGDGTCNCERFSRQVTDGPPICWECNHGISKHPGATLTEHPPAPPPDVTPPPPSQPRTLATMSTTSSDRRVMGILHNLTARQTTLQSDARAKALVTLSSQKQVDSGKLAKGSRKARVPTTGAGHVLPVASSQSNSVFHISSVAMVICGIDKDGKLKDAKAPNGAKYWADIQLMRNQRCFVSSATGNGIAINSSWTHSDINKQLRIIFNC
ncbi:hypothetical protein EDC04DRAFT_2613412 [Pisolithus marmoratus]|nr:hypothetical protein EDC04DRAFT_2613412 [Pisolithus marmoratus]